MCADDNEEEVGDGDSDFVRENEGKDSTRKSLEKDF